MNTKTVSIFYLLVIIVSTIFAQTPKSITLEDAKVAQLRLFVKLLLKMDLSEVKDNVPSKSGLNFIGCPNCHGGAQDMGVLNWEPALGSSVKCKYCGLVFPNEKFPYTNETVIMAPSGAKQVYRYHESKEGVKYYFEAHSWFEKWKWIQENASQLSQLWVMTKDPAYGDRAAVILGRFAQVFPDYAIRYDYPSAPVRFFPANQKWPYEGLQAYRGAKWNWWGYGDIPADMARAYKNLKDYDWKRMDNIIGAETDKRIENDFLLKGYEFTSANPETYSNMSPGTYRDIVSVGRILKKPELIHDGVARFREFLKLGFFADGWWKEGTVSYHDQTVNSLKSVALAAQNYTDPIDRSGDRFDNLDLNAEMPFFKTALKVSEEAILPNGRKIPINDTWAYRNGIPKPTDKTVSRLWNSVGNAALGVGDGIGQTMLNLNWSGNYGHSHYDNGSIILFAQGQELLSDIGYTHGKYRGWTIHTASHNTVVIDQKVQDSGTNENPVTGNLLFYDDKHPNVKVIDVDASPAYGNAELYRRRLILVHTAPGRDYVIDRFDVKGGETHDWFLHGMCEEEGNLSLSIPLNDLKTIVPDWGGINEPKNQYDSDIVGKKTHAYSYLRDLKSANASGSWTATWRYETSGLRTHSFSQQGTQVVSFKAPSIRRANEDDNKLNEYLSNGILQRHRGGESSFIAVHEPFAKEPWIKFVDFKDGIIVVKYDLGGRSIEDRIDFKNRNVSVVSNGGWEYNSSQGSSGRLLGYKRNNGLSMLELDKEFTSVNYVRLETPGGRMMYYQVKNVKGNVLELKDDPGFTMDEKGNLKFFTFPHEEVKGPIGFTAF